MSSDVRISSLVFLLSTTNSLTNDFTMQSLNFLHSSVWNTVHHQKQGSNTICSHSGYKYSLPVGHANIGATDITFIRWCLGSDVEHQVQENSGCNGPDGLYRHDSTTTSLELHSFLWIIHAKHAQGKYALGKSRKLVALVFLLISMRQWTMSFKTTNTI